uniref:Uncharacterized protein n=1 Tax=Arion vulgaris TaxID=1028688 RepID=A0A0B6YQA3_9EUPU
MSLVCCVVMFYRETVLLVIGAGNSGMDPQRCERQGGWGKHKEDVQLSSISSFEKLDKS